MSEDKEHYGIYRRPHYAPRARVRIALDYGPYTGVEATVTDVSALQTVGGDVVTYLYTVRLDNLAYIKLTEEQLAPLASSVGG